MKSRSVCANRERVERERRCSVFAVQKIRSILSNGIEQIADIAVEQQHTHGDGWHANR